MVGILVVSYGARACSMIDAFSRSLHKTEFYIADRQRNPFNAKIAKEHAVIPDLNVAKIKDKIDFGVVGPENPIIDGIRDEMEKIGVQMVCPSRKFAIEGSKIRQREILEKVKGVNPRYKIFSDSSSKTRKDLFKWLDELDNQVAVKPDLPGYGKGVGVWGDHFNSREDLWEHFLSIIENSPVIIEEKIEGEEFSLQCFSDGKKLVTTPVVRDYKRAFEDDKGPNTGGMGSYKNSKNILPFMEREDLEDAENIAEKIFRELKGNGSEPGLRGIPMYIAFTCSSDGLKVFEINNRLGMPEAQNIMPIMKSDFVDVCFDILDGKLGRIIFDSKATVVTYKVPPAYGGRESRNFDRKVDLSGAVESENIKIYPCAMEIINGETFATGSRTVCSVGIGESIEDARQNSLTGIESVKGDLWYRKDIASQTHIQKSINNVKRLRNL
jgi:phosphoribosylamine---glycine ligase